MKITRRQLRKIIKEAIDPNADQQEAAYAIIYAEAYVTKFNQYFGNAVHDRKFMTTQTTVSYTHLTLPTTPYV